MTSCTIGKDFGTGSMRPVLVDVAPGREMASNVAATLRARHFERRHGPGADYVQGTDGRPNDRGRRA